jgi:hypothetical protein
MRTNFPHSEQLNRLALRPNEEMYTGRRSPFERVMRHGTEHHCFIPQQHIPNATLIVYPDCGHGAIFQYPELSVSHVRLFLEQ